MVGFVLIVERLVGTLSVESSFAELATNSSEIDGLIDELSVAVLFGNGVVFQWGVDDTGDVVCTVGATDVGGGV